MRRALLLMVVALLIVAGAPAGASAADGPSPRVAPVVNAGSDATVNEGSLWTQAGAFVFRYGEHFYNFQGLRQYKEKFNPVWQPKYLACPRGLVLPRILTNLAALISGGLKGIITK